MSKFAARIKNARINAGLSQVELAQRLEVDQSHMSRLENGTREPSRDVLTHLAKVLDVPVSFFLGESVSVFRPSGIAHDIATDPTSPPGLIELATDTSLTESLGITGDEWHVLRDTPVKGVSKNGYVQLLITIRAVTGS